MSDAALETESLEALTPLLDEGRYNDVGAVSTTFSDLLVPHAYLRRLSNPSADTAVPLEYAFHLLGDLHGKTVIDLGCGGGLNVVIQAVLGARVIAMDNSEEHLRRTAERVQANSVCENVSLVQCDPGALPVAAGTVDRVLCVATLRDVDCLVTARQIRRVLKPGGAAVFVEPIAGPHWLRAIKRLFSQPEKVLDRHSPIASEQVVSVTRAVGRGGRQRDFIFASRIPEHVSAPWFSTEKGFRQADAWILRRFPFIRAFASPLVWEARKES